MSTIVTRTGKGSSLSWAEADANFTNLNNDKVETSALGDSALLDVGTTAGTVAAGDHTHTGVYEPADASILKDADIGSTVLGYVAPSTAGNVLTSNGSAWTSTTPTATYGLAFQAYSTGTTSASSNSWTKIVLAGEDFDTDSCFASSRFTPTEAGYYQISASLSLNGNSSTTQFAVAIYKNGGQYGARLFDCNPSADLNVNGATAGSGDVLIYLNGSTDYVELYGYYYAGTATFGSATRGTAAQMSGVWVRA